MTTLLQRAFDLAKALPDDRQDELGEMLLSVIEQEKSPLRLSQDQIAEIRRRRADPGPLATDREVEAAFKKLGG
jgi:hypothetical protein